VSWQELRDVCKLAGCIEARTKSDHLIMTRAGMARPIVIKMDKDLGEDTVRTNLRTLGLSRKEFERLLEIVRGHGRS
jgi:hypothetical protein